ncbi:aromatic amino acid lyase [Actinoplanes sp. NPDC051411]|uniref:aromatic amino acid lyase n=1 Tax=Actinoplanes sp. NPDC051411 TaxID=3155522 RepID=UPI00342603D7
MIIRRPEDLDLRVIDRVARGVDRISLAPALLDELGSRRAAMLAALRGDEPVYGVNTGMGAFSGVRLDAEAQAQHQNTLMLGRAVGSAPWLQRVDARAVVAARLRTLMHPAAGASPDLCLKLVSLLDLDVVPAVPARGSGAAGEIIPLAHLGAALIGAGEFVVASPAFEPRPFEAKEGVAFLEGVPGLTGMAAVACGAARALISEVVTVSGLEQAIVGASLDPLHPSLGRGDDQLARVSEALRTARGDAPARGLQAPVSFRVTAPALAVALRSVTALEEAVGRALDTVTDSPAYLEGRFVGTAGFAGTELTAACGTLTTALVHLAELGATRLHRLLDDARTGLPRQLADTPGRHAGMATVHKRAVGVAHRMRRFAVPALVGSMETSLGQEDVQSFTFEAAECLREALDGLREVVACELLAVHQAGLLGAVLPPAGLVDEAAGLLPPGTVDRPFGRDIDTLTGLLRGRRDQASG